MGKTQQSTSPVADAVRNTIPTLKNLYDVSDRDCPENFLRHFPDSNHVIRAHRLMIDAMLPGRVFTDGQACFDLEYFLTQRLTEAMNLLLPELCKAIPFRWKSAHAVRAGVEPQPEVKDLCRDLLQQFVNGLPDVRNFIVEDIKAAYMGDPAALNYAEVQLAYPGLLAIASHRIAHTLYNLQVPIIPRIMSEWVHAKTGVDINPGARIGHGFFIDHATGVVIGETCQIGNNVKLYQGVTLGAKSAALEKGHEGKGTSKRHPTVEDDVVIYANATILGGETVIGKGSTIGGNVFITKSVAPHSFIVPRSAGNKVHTRGEDKFPNHYSI